MAYIIDGNNVMGRKRTRLELLALLSDFFSVARTRVTVVFDGAPEERYPEGSSYKGVKIFYSRPGSSADDRIRSIFSSARNPRELIVVTSDRSLAGQARSYGARQLNSQQFLSLVDETFSARENLKNLEKPSIEAELDDWISYFGYESCE
jgi:predicted RNA-binding protein with PIN domain